ncbi:MAG: ABC transporter substrate-binding protein [Janthinobacterium lividum]
MSVPSATARLLGCLFSAAALTLLAGGCANKPSGSAASSGGSTAANSIMIGEYGSLTGDKSTFGHSTDNGVELAVKAINSAGGVNGHQLTVDVQDDAGTPDGASSVVKKIITSDKPTAVIGEVASTLSIQAAPICNAAKVPMISPSSTNPKVTQLGNYIFRVCFIDPFQGTAAAKFASGTLHAKKAAILTDAGNDYSIGLTKFFTESLTKAGGQIVIAQNYGKDDVDFSSQLTQIKALNPDILYVPGYYGQVGPIAKQARAIGLMVPLLGGDGWDSPKLVEGAGGPNGALEGSYFTNHSSMSNPDPTIQTFVTNYKTAYGGQQPDSIAALAYDSVGVLVDAIKRAGTPADGDYSSLDYRAKLRDAIASTKGYKGITGTITIGPDRNAVKPAVVLQIHGSDYKYITTVNP